MTGAYSGLRLYLSNELAGCLSCLQGGDVVAPAVAGVNQSKHLGVPYAEPITIQFSPADVRKPLYTWLATTLDHAATPIDGAILAEVDEQEVSRLTFRHAMITEIQFSGLDSASPGTALITVILQPEYTSRTFFKGSINAAASPTNLTRFSVKIPTLATDRVRKMPAIVFKQSPSTDSIISNLVLTVPSADIATFQSWYEDFVLKGNCGASQEKQGSLRFGVCRSDDELFSLNFNHLGIVRLGLETPQTLQNLAPDYRLELYCYGISLSPGRMLAR